MAFKLIYLAKRNPAIVPADFPEAWRSHSRLASTLAQTMGQHFVRVRQCIKAHEADVPAEYHNEHDGTALLTLRSWDSLVKARYHPDALRIMHADEPRVFAGHVAPWTMAAEEVRLIEKREGNAALVHFFPRGRDCDAYTFQEKWTGEYADRIGSLQKVATGAAVFALNHVLDAPSPAYTFAGVSELWFDDLESARAVAWDPAHRAALHGIHSLCDPVRCVSLLIRVNFEKVKAERAQSWSGKAPA